MKRLFVIIVVFLSLFVVSAVSAETYKVKRGDSLSKIASKYSGVNWRDIYEVNRNKIKKPSLIYVGQKFVIPKSKSKSRVHYWKHPGAEKFGKRDMVKAIRMFSLPEEVKKEAIQKLRKKKWHYFTIQSGDRFEEMFFGNYRKWTNVVAAWRKDTFYLGRKVRIEHKGKIYHIGFPLICHNISWWSEDKPVKKVVLPPAKPKPITKVKKPKKYWVDYDAYLWAGHFLALGGSGYSNYYGGKFNLWLNRHQTSFGLLKEGFSTIYNGWDGRSGSGFSFHGKRWTVGPAISLLRGDKSETVFSIQLGKQTDVGRSADGFYHAKQKTDILHFGLTHDFYPKTKHIEKVSMYAEYIRDIGHTKKSTWKQWLINPKNDRATDKSLIAGGVKLHTWRTKKIKGGFIGGADYGFGDHHRGVELGVFITDLNEYVTTSVRFRNVSNSIYRDTNGNSIGIGIEFDIKNLKRIIWKVKKKKS